MRDIARPNNDSLYIVCTLDLRKDPVILEMPAVGEKDADIFENNLLEVMQFVFNHTTFDPNNELDQKLLAAYEPLGVAPGKAYDPDKVAKIDGKRARQVAERISSEEMARTTDKAFQKKAMMALFKPKGEISLDFLLYQSVAGPIGVPANEAVYPNIGTTDGEPMNANHDYVTRITADALPPAQAFCSFTLYDTKNGFIARSVPALASAARIRRAR